MSAARLRTPLLGLSVLAALALTDRPAAAQTFTVTFSGVISQIGTSVSSGLPSPWGPTVQVGTPFTETFAWDRSVAATPVNGLRTVWETKDIARGATITVGGVDITPFQNANQVATSLTQPDYAVEASEYNANGKGSHTGIAYIAHGGLLTGADSGLRYEDSTLSLYDPAPAKAMSLTDPGADWLDTFSRSELDIFAVMPSSGDTQYYLGGYVTRVTGVGLTAAPEPSQAAALGLGGLVLAGLVLRSRKKANPV